MRRSRIRRNSQASGSKRKLLGWLVLLSLLFGLVEFGQPFDLALRNLRDKARAQPTSGKVVVVGIDDKALAQVGPWQWNRRELASLTEGLFAAGADRVFFDLYFKPMERGGDRKFVEAVARHPGRVFVASGLDNYSRPGQSVPILPMPEIAGKAETVSVMRWIHYWNGATTVSYRRQFGSHDVRSMEAAIAGVDGNRGEEFPIDYSYRISSVPYISAADILSGKVQANALKGKAVIVGVNSALLEDIFVAPGQGRVAGVFVIAIGAETLLKQPPIGLGWIPPWLFAVGTTAWFVFGRRRRIATAIGAAGIAALLAFPLLLEHFSIFVDVAPALFLAIVTMIIVGWQRFGAAKQSQGAINPVSGLKTVNALLREGLSDPNILVAVRLRRFADIVSTLPPDGERDLLGQIVSRLAMGAGQAQLLHGDDGNFFWLMPEAELASVVDRFKALQLIFRNPIRVSEKSFDVEVFFGVDREIHMPLSHRLASALAAAHAASEEGGCWKIHDPSATGAREWALSLLGELDQAIDAGHIWVAYQPKMELATGAIVGAEALVRWTHATRGPIDPAEFVEMAERHGRIDRLTAFVLNDAARAAAAAVAYDPGFAISVNISPQLLATREVVDMVRRVLRKHRLPASALVLEITETAAMVEGQTALKLLEELRAMGVELSIDDYGTGMSTLAYLRRIPANELKVDKRFAASLLSSPEDQAVMRSTIELAHTLGMHVVAEGVETAETLQMLRAMGCEIGQGYHIGRPMEWLSFMDIFSPRPSRAADG
ncbi:EAL domain-containing protein [Sphingomonas cavernae]|nr:EAL domain-containing protein [Sphingomonas cavernae]